MTKPFLGHAFDPGRFSGKCQVQLSRYPCPYPSEAHPKEEAMTEALEPEQPESDIRPELQINVSQTGLKTAAEILTQVIPNLPEDAYTEIAGRVIAAALSAPPTVTNKTVETLTRAMLMSYPSAEAWAEANRRQIVLGLLLSLGVETKG